MLKQSKRKKRKDTFAKTQYKKLKKSEKAAVENKTAGILRNQDREAEIDKLIK